MDEQEKLSFKFAFNATKQLMTLATGIIALTITFSKEYLKTDGSDFKFLAIIGWLLFLLSIAFGQWTLHALTGSLALKEEKTSINNWNVRFPSMLQVFTFIIALGISIFFVAIAL